MIGAALTDIVGIGIVIVLLRMNHSIGKLTQSFEHFGTIVDDHEVRIRQVEQRPNTEINIDQRQPESGDPPSRGPVIRGA